MQVGISKPQPELLHVEDQVLHSDTVEDRCVQEHLLLELKVEQCVPDVVKASECHVVDLVDPFFVHGFTCEDREVAEQELHHHIEHVLVEHEKDKLSIASVGLSAVNEQ